MEPDKKVLRKLNTNAKQLARFARENNYNTSMGFLIDMSIESGKYRFFVYDFQHDSILDTGLVAHGRCNEEWLQGRRYSNEEGGGCTSLGRYRIGEAYKGKFGNSFKLYGLDNSNSNAFKRYVVLHPFQYVPDKEVAPLPICQSDGCPMVSPAFMRKLESLIKNSPRSVVMWIYE